MQVIYALFDRYTDARAAVEELLDEGYEEREMNALVQAEVAKEYMELDLERVDVKVTDAVGERTAHGFDPFLAAQTPVSIPGLGKVYAAGDLATVLVKTAATHGAGSEGLRTALQDAVPADAARVFAEGVSQGGVLFWIRTDEEQGAVVAQTLRRHHGKQVGDYVG